MSEQKFIKVSESFFVDADFRASLGQLSLDSIESVFSFEGGKNLSKKNLAAHRTRIRFELSEPSTTLFLKRYDNPPVFAQLKNWLSHRRRLSLACADFRPAEELAKAGINTPKTVAYGRQWADFFEKRSFIITEKIPDADSLERKLPDCFSRPRAAENLKLRKNFILRLADFIKKFHDTGYRHRDLYLCHIFGDTDGEFYLIDLARVFKPKLLARRFRVKDIAQLYYSADGRHFSKTDRLRFYRRLTGRTKLSAKDRRFISAVKNKVKKIAAHDIKHRGTRPFAS